MLKHSLSLWERVKVRALARTLLKQASPHAE